MAWHVMGTAFREFNQFPSVPLKVKNYAEEDLLLILLAVRPS